jgi:hypothetical protein
MEFSNWLMMEEIFPNKTATIFHRAGANATSESITNILNSDFKSGEGAGCLYGCGLYATFSLESQFHSSMGMYGPFIIKFKITDLDKYIIIPPNVAKYVKGDRWKLSQQLQDSYPHLIADLKEDDLETLDLRQARTTSKSFVPMLIREKVKGVLYRDLHGYTIVKYEPVNDGSITMIGYAVANALDTDKMKELQNPSAWITSTDTAKIRDIYKQAGKSSKIYPVRSDLLSADRIQDMLLFKTDEAEKLDKSEFEKLTTTDLTTLMRDNRRNKFIEILGPKVVSTLKNITLTEAFDLFSYILGRTNDAVPWFKKFLGEKFLNNFTSNHYKELLFYVNSPMDMEIKGNRLGELINRIRPDDIQYELKTFKSYLEEPMRKENAAKSIEVILNLIRNYYEDQNFVDSMFRQYGRDLGPAPKKIGQMPAITGEKKKPVFGESFVLRKRSRKIL